MASISVSPSQHLATVKRERVGARRNLAAVTAEIHKVEDENDKLRTSPAAFRNTFHMPRPSLVNLMSQLDSVFYQIPPTDDVDDATL